LLVWWLGVAAGSLLALEVPPLAGRVADLADLLDDETEALVEQWVAGLESERGAQVAVLTVPSLEGDDLEDFSIRVADAWRLGREGIDDGVLLVVARDERRLRLEVGYGLEGTIPDAVARRIVDGVIVPRFQEGDPAGGVADGVAVVVQLIRGDTTPEHLPAEPNAWSHGWLGQIWEASRGCLVPFVMIAFVILFTVLERRYPKLFAKIARASGSGWAPTSGSHRSSWSSSTASGSSTSARSSSSSSRGFSGGGGRFGGGGASGRW
jgi:uncharacterized protein